MVQPGYATSFLVRKKYELAGGRDMVCATGVCAREHDLVGLEARCEVILREVESEDVMAWCRRGARAAADIEAVGDEHPLIRDEADVEEKGRRRRGRGLIEVRPFLPTPRGRVGLDDEFSQLPASEVDAISGLELDVESWTVG